MTYQIEPGNIFVSSKLLWKFHARDIISTFSCGVDCRVWVAINHQESHFSFAWTRPANLDLHACWVITLINYKCQITYLYESIVNMYHIYGQAKYKLQATHTHTAWMTVMCARNCLLLAVSPYPIWRVHLNFFFKKRKNSWCTCTCVYFLSFILVKNIVRDVNSRLLLWYGIVTHRWTRPPYNLD